METNNNPWIYKGNVVTPDLIPIGSVGFVYAITDEYTHPLLNWEKKVIYIGKKSLLSTTKKKISKRDQLKEKEITGDGRVHKVKKVVKGSGWENYLTSSIEVKKLLLEHPERYSRIVIEFAHSKQHLSYLECKHIIVNSMLERETYNLNLMGKFYRNIFIKQEPK